MTKQIHWNNDDEEEYETPVDARGIKYKYRKSINNKGQKVMTVTQLKINEVKVKVNNRIIQRMNISKFGDAINNDNNTTMQSKDIVLLEYTNDILVEESGDQTLGSALMNFVIKQQERQLERDYDVSNFASAENPTENGDVIEDKAKTGVSKYVPPSKRNIASTDKSESDTESTIRVSNLSKNVKEEDLYELFGRFGPIHRVSLPRNTIREPRGFAYIAFVRHADAERAIERLQGHGYDHLILQLEWAKPVRKETLSSGLSQGHMSGYGQKLAQETKEVVSFNSNLTENK